VSRYLSFLGLLAATLTVSTEAAAQANAVAPWQTHLIWWGPTAEEPHPWRTDAHLARFGEPRYPDDFQVLFRNPDSAQGKQHEIMWVRVIAADSATGLRLGILLNQPDFMRSPSQGDNVVFRLLETDPLPTAVGGPSYRDVGWPDNSAAPEFQAVLRKGILAYREGDNGHNMPGIEKCISVLAPAMQAVPAGASAEERFTGHFVLGRCLAETYVTERAIEQFRAAITIDPNELNAQMALLAELSIMAHKGAKDLSPDEEKRWDDAVVEQLQVIRTRFGDRPIVQRMLSLLFTPPAEKDMTPAMRAELPKLQRVGYAIFRWKQR
jgi:hypothetical protein